MKSKLASRGMHQFSHSIDELKMIVLVKIKISVLDSA